MNFAFSQSFDPNKLFLVKNYCPGEHCRIPKIWEPLKSMPIYPEPDQTLTVIGRTQKGSKIELLTSFAYIRPQKYVAPIDFGKYKKGEVIWILEYSSEGFYNSWHKGEYSDIELGYPPGGKLFQGEMLPYEVQEWGKFEDQNGLQGWIFIERNGFKFDTNAL